MKHRMLTLAMLVTAAALAASAGFAPAPTPAPAPAGGPTAPPATSMSPRTTGAAAEVDPVIAAFMQPVEIAQGDDPLRQKLKERHNTAARLLHIRLDAYHRGLTDVGTVFDAARIVADAKAALVQNAQEREALARQVLDVSRVAESRLEQQWRAGVATEANFLRARLARQDAEIGLLQATRGGGGGDAATQPANAPPPPR